VLMMVALSVLRGCARNQRSVVVMGRVIHVRVQMVLPAMTVGMLSEHHVLTLHAAVSFIHHSFSFSYLFIKSYAHNKHTCRQ